MTNARWREYQDGWAIAAVIDLTPNNIAAMRRYGNKWKRGMS